jgi:orotate phosphoribosyltransferase
VTWEQEARERLDAVSLMGEFVLRDGTTSDRYIDIGTATLPQLARLGHDLAHALDEIEGLHRTIAVLAVAAGPEARERARRTLDAAERPVPWEEPCA